ncbi:hypothetical protein SAMN05421803_103462 [Nocardiopsis flavescens]|uniref:ATPase AAA-type core domain-containing protein n=1 Tax=Nocardiopsis flavescens TaxID=758803 RepID=A0A1M6GMC9_9ACTN|nr:ATP-binding protein [Nocardiopsis flavescens]SHJ11117.1 hypothetical protein SAMN05421803_103462 [Nocardiopsis flavescens]
MLLSFRVENHRSIRDEQELLLTSAAQGEEGFPPPGEITPLRVAGIFGANASGKSSVVGALEFMRRMVTDQDSITLDAVFAGEHPETEIIRDPFLLDGAGSSKPSTYAVDILLGGARFNYGFVVDDHRVMEEWLYAHGPDGSESPVFEREGEAISYAKNDPGAPELTDLLDISPHKLLISVLANVRPAMFHSDAVQDLRTVREWFLSSLKTWGGGKGYEIPRNAVEDEELVGRLAEMAASADTGINGYVVQMIPEDLSSGEVGYLTPRQLRNRKKILFRHKGEDNGRPLRLQQESEGTRAVLALGSELIRVLKEGSTLVVDELDTSLHSVLSGALVSLFNDPQNNPNRAQLVFTSHDTNLLGRIRGREVLTEDEIWLTEKGHDGATTLYPLSSFETADEENRDRRYLVGRYGAVPFIDEELFIKALRPRPRE